MDRDDRLIRAVQSAAKRLTGSGDFDALLKDVLKMAVEAVGAAGGTIYLHDEAHRRLRFRHVLPEGLRDKLPVLDIPDDFGVAGEAFQSAHIIRRTYPTKKKSDWNEWERATGAQVRSIIATPLAIEAERPIGVVQLLNKRDGPFEENDAAVLDTISTVATMAFHNAVLRAESERAGALLGMGKVSHDMGNLAASLNASVNVGAYVAGRLQDHTRAGPDDTTRDLVAHLGPTFEDLKSSVSRLVGYAGLISDMSAGRELRPALVPMRIGPATRASARYLESDARARGVALIDAADETAPETLCDELFVFRIVQNLIGNGLKAVVECGDPGGHVTYRTAFDGESHLIEIEDSGKGMTRDVADRILSGTARSEWDQSGGSGWGTKIVRELTHALGGEVRIETELGVGTTFRVFLPHRPVARAS